MIDGSTPPSAPVTNVAIGVTPNSLAFSSLITTTAAAPSLIPDALPAVTTPSGLPEQHLNLLRVSTVVPALGPSSVSTMIVCFLVLTSTGTISSLNFPSAIAFSHFCCELAENSSNSSLVSPH